jgi:hypothetical protein
MSHPSPATPNVVPISNGIYVRNGYKDRADYLRQLADDNGVPHDVVLAMADMLGPNEDFDGLVGEVEDMRDLGVM